MPHTDSPYGQCRPCRRHPERASRMLREQKIRCDHEAHKQRWAARAKMDDMTSAVTDPVASLTIPARGR